MPEWRLSDDSGIPITVTQPDDPAYVLLQDDFTSNPAIYRKGCYICEDPEFAQMGLPLCRKCLKCGGHVAADDTICDDCGTDQQELWYMSMWEVVLNQPHSICRGDKHRGTDA